MSNLRAFSKLLLFLLASAFYYSVILFGHIVSIFGGNKKLWAAKYRSIWGRVVSSILGIKYTVVGNPPKPPFFLVANHLSYIDIFLLFSTARGTFIAKGDLRSWPVVGFVLATTGIIFVDRSKKTDVKRVNKEISSKLDENQGIFLFPEATTSSGRDVLPFKSSLFQYPAQEEIEVSSAAISYNTTPNKSVAYQQLCWWDDTPFLAHFWNVLKLKEFEATIVYSEEKIRHSNRKILANSTFNIVKSCFIPVFHPQDYAKANLSS